MLDLKAALQIASSLGHLLTTSNLLSVQTDHESVVLGNGKNDEHCFDSTTLGCWSIYRLLDLNSSFIRQGHVQVCFMKPLNPSSVWFVQILHRNMCAESEYVTNIVMECRKKVLLISTHIDLCRILHQLQF